MTQTKRDINQEKTLVFLSRTTSFLSDFIGDPPRTAPQKLIDDCLILRNQLLKILPILGSSITQRSLDKLVESADKIKNATEEINDAIKSITGTNKTLNDLSNFVGFAGKLFDAIKGRSLLNISNIFLDFVDSLR